MQILSSPEDLDHLLLPGWDLSIPSTPSRFGGRHQMTPPSDTLPPSSHSYLRGLYSDPPRSQTQCYSLRHRWLLLTGCGTVKTVKYTSQVPTEQSLKPPLSSMNQDEAVPVKSTAAKSILPQETATSLRLEATGHQKSRTEEGTAKR